MSLFTVILEYDEETFIDQIVTSEIENVYSKWIETGSQMNYLNSVDEKTLRNSKIDEMYSLVELENLINAWSTSITLSKGLAMITLIMTVEKVVGSVQ